MDSQVVEMHNADSKQQEKHSAEDLIEDLSAGFQDGKSLLKNKADKMGIMKAMGTRVMMKQEGKSKPRSHIKAFPRMPRV